METGFSLAERLAADTVWVDRLPLCELLLINDRRYPWFLLVPRRAGLTELFQLSAEDEAELWRESRRLQQTMQQAYTPDKLNVASIGNLVPQLHLHHVARRQGDEAWPAPVWGRGEPVRYTESEQDELLTEFRTLWAK